MAPFRDSWATDLPRNHANIDSTKDAHRDIDILLIRILVSLFNSTERLYKTSDDVSSFGQRE